MEDEAPSFVVERSRRQSAMSFSSNTDLIAPRPLTDDEEALAIEKEVDLGDRIATDGR